MDYRKIELNLNNLCSYAWDMTKDHLGPLVGIQFLALLCGSITQSAGKQPDSIAMFELIASGNFKGLAALEKAAKDAPITMAEVMTVVVSIIIAIILTNYLTLVTYRYIKGVVNEDVHLDLTEKLKSSCKLFIPFFLKIFVYGIVMCLATLCCILPAIYLAVRLVFVPYIAANRPELSIGETFSLSMELTNGRFLQLLGYGIVASIIAMLGFILCCLGQLVTIPYTNVMLGMLYEQLMAEKHPEEITENAEIQ